jgi:hypothetical protein
MAFDETVAVALRDALARRGVTAEEKKMFGGLAFMQTGHMVVGIMNTGQIMGRVDPADGPEIAKRLSAQPMELGGRTMWGFLLADVSVADAMTDSSLAWVRTQAPKKARK